MALFKRAVSATTVAALAATPFLVLWQRQNIYDAWRLHNYQAPAAIARLAEVTTMNSYGRKVFYVERPQLQELETFRTNCTTSEQTIVLGCYKSRNGIFVYDVKDIRLNGVQEVTSAHEMLHAAYERLSTKEKDRINALTDQAYASLNDVRIKKNIDAYRSKDPSVVPNELHSILGTEVKTLPAELEDYYRRYFNDRSAIVGFSEQYESEFTNRENAIANYDAELLTLKATIDEYNMSLEDQGRAIDKEASRLQALLAAKKVSDYNAGIPGYQQLIRAYNQDLATLKKTITTYNTTVEKRNAIVGEERSLFKSLDTRTPATR